MWNEIPLAQNPGKGFMFSNKKLNGGRIALPLVYGEARGGEVSRLPVHFAPVPERKRQCPSTSC
jgi:hypothetical protein